MPKKPTPQPSLDASIKEHWGDRGRLSGSRSPWLTCNLANQVLRTPYRGHGQDAASKEIQDQAALDAMAGIAPRDPVEGLLAAQMVAVHEAAMDCFRRAAIPEQTYAGRDLALKHGAKLARTYAALVEALDRHRGKGQPQVVRVERVTVEAGGQAIVGAIAPGGGGHAQGEERPHARAAIAHAAEPLLRGADPERAAVPAAAGHR
jgi:hypothetical protein